MKMNEKEFREKYQKASYATFYTGEKIIFREIIYGNEGLSLQVWDQNENAVYKVVLAQTDFTSETLSVPQFCLLASYVRISQAEKHFNELFDMTIERSVHEQIQINREEALLEVGSYLNKTIKKASEALAIFGVETMSRDLMETILQDLKNVQFFVGRCEEKLIQERKEKEHA